MQQIWKLRHPLLQVHIFNFLGLSLSFNDFKVDVFNHLLIASLKLNHVS